jgi:hypothetical protein
MYGISVLFLGVVAGINKLMVPIFQTMNTAGGEMLLSNPCSNSGSPVCSLFTSTCSVFQILPDSISCYYTSLFFWMSIVQAICCGLVAGQISENSVMAGLKHSIILAAITFGAFNILVRFGVLG